MQRHAFPVFSEVHRVKKTDDEIICDASRSSPTRLYVEFSTGCLGLFAFPSICVSTCLNYRRVLLTKISMIVLFNIHHRHYIPHIIPSFHHFALSFTEEKNRLQREINKQFNYSELWRQSVFIWLDNQDESSRVRPSPLKVLRASHAYIRIRETNL